MRVSNDNGDTFGPILTLTANGTISGSTEEEEGEEGEVEGAVEEAAAGEEEVAQ
jgi:hypothetical protein